MRSTLLVLLLPITACADPPEVVVVRPVENQVLDRVDFTGRTEPSTSVDIRARTTGHVESVHFKEGSLVGKGDLLFQLDSRLQKAQLARAEAEVVAAEAKLKLADVTLQRLLALAKMGTISREEVDSAAANLGVAKAAMLAAHANLDIAKLNLEYTRIVAPIQGRIGRCHVAPGNLVKGDGETSLATIIVTDPLHVSFEVDERSLLRILRATRDGKDSKVTVAVTVGGDGPQPAQLDFVDTKVDPATGTLRARALLDNPKGRLLPGLFAKVRCAIGEPYKALLVPESCIARTPDGPFVLIVEEKNRLVERKVRIGQSVEGLRVIEEGLNADERVLVDPRGRKAGEEVMPRLKG